MTERVRLGYQPLHPDDARDYANAHARHHCRQESPNTDPGGSKASRRRHAYGPRGTSSDARRESDDADETGYYRSRGTLHHSYLKQLIEDRSWAADDYCA